jgi:hypothetical protein
MNYDSSTSRPSSPSVDILDEEDRGRLLTRIPGIVRSPGCPRTLRHTGPSIHLWIQRHSGSPNRHALRNSSFPASDEALDKRSDEQGRDREVSPPSRSSYSSLRLNGSDSRGRTNLHTTRRRNLERPTDGIAANSEHLSPFDSGVTVTRILTAPRRGPRDDFVPHYDATRKHNPAADKDLTPRQDIPRRPSPVTAGMRYAALWEWVCSDAVSTTRIQSICPGILNPPGRFVEYENFACRYMVLLSISGGESKAATGMRTQQ